MKLIPQIAILLFCLTLSSCLKNPTDSENPSIQIAEDPVESEVESGEFIEYALDLQDNILLDELFVRVVCPVSDFDSTAVHSLTGQSVSWSSGYILPINLFKDECQIEFYCTDDEGNTSETLGFSFPVVNGLDSKEPFIEITNPEDCEIGIIAEPSSLGITLEGIIDDESPIIEVSINILDSSNNLHTPLIQETLETTEYSLTVINQLTPSENGDFFIQVLATDSLLNMSEKLIPLTIEE